MKKTKVAINGFGRIGRAFFKLAALRSELEIVAVNDLGDKSNLEYLLTYDSVYGKTGERIIKQFRAVEFLQERNPENLPWGDLGVEIVVESTGVFTSYEKAKVHLASGARRVVVSAPVKDNPEDAGVTGATILMGVNDDDLKVNDISSNASCTTNAGSPVIGILDEVIGIEKAMLNTVHGYTATQKTVDGPSPKDPRRGRAAAVNIIPTSTGAAKATTQAHTQLEDKFDGIALRVPVPSGSIADITFIAKRDTSVEEVNEVLSAAAGNARWSTVFTVTNEPLVSTDIIGDTHASIADLGMTRVVGGNLVKVLAWYDNEVGYAQALVEHVITSGSHI
ncbi:MAG: type I glyceraldehyde-3-phosphate dehydrogenase [Parcubacteria group bacterium]|nr:type I glyceraldehyde-3-phosphate dehydrogenase [Parcubacteria group bacterium]|tara:strand:+ start:183 stop:1190 length:1008 start_codon:yes stop_codon:yes gene_type:complete